MTDTATAPTVPGTSPRKEQMPSYPVSKVDGELPEDLTAQGRSDLYFNLLTKVAQDPGEWYLVAHFKTPGGARAALNSLTTNDEDKKRRIPDGEWEFDVRRVPNPDNPAGPKHSKLFARLMG